MDAGTDHQLPEGCELCLDVFLISDSEGIEAVIGMSGIRSIASVQKLAADPETLKAAVNRMAGDMTVIAPDLRPMTQAEVEDYKRRQDEGESDEYDER